MYVQYDCNRPSTFRDLLRKRSVCQNVLIGHSSEPKVGQSSYTFRDMLRKRNVHGRPYAATSSFSPLRPCILNFD